MSSFGNIIKKEIKELLTPAAIIPVIIIAFIFGSIGSSMEGIQESFYEKPEYLKKIWWYDCDPEAPKQNIHEYIGNRRESPSNIKSMPVFNNGKVYLTAGGDIWWGKRECRLICVDASLTGDITRSGEIWSFLDRGLCCPRCRLAPGRKWCIDRTGF